MKNCTILFVGFVLSLVSCHSAPKYRKPTEKKQTTMSMRAAVAGDAIRIALEGTGNAIIDWGDGTKTDSLSLIPNRSHHTHTYKDTNSHLITIAGDKITFLDCSYCQLTQLNVKQNKDLETLICGWNKLTSLDLSQNKALKRLTCHENQLTSLDLSHNTLLVDVFCIHNCLSFLAISKCHEIALLDCSGNQLTNLDLRKNTKLTALNCGSNQLKTLQPRVS
jgi:hypothetical protein